MKGINELFTTKVLARSKEIPVIVEFSYAGCGPCHWMEQTLAQITREQQGSIEFVSIDISKNTDLMNDYKVKSNPTTLLFVDGQEVSRLTGALPKMVIEQWINDHLNFAVISKQLQHS